MDIPNLPLDDASYRRRVSACGYTTGTKFILGFGWWYLQAFGLLIEPACIVRVEGGHRIKPSPENVLAVVHRLGGRPGVVLLPTFQLQVRLLPDFAPTSRAWTDGESDSAAHRQPIAPPGPAVR